MLGSVFAPAYCSAGVSLLHSVCVQVRRKLLGTSSIHCTSKCRYLIWNTGGLRRAAGKDTPLFINGLSGWDVLQKAWSKSRECVWVDRIGGVESVCHQLAEQSAGAHITFRWLLLSLEIFQLGMKAFLKSDFALQLFTCEPVSCIWEWSQQLYGCRCPTPFKNQAPFWYEWGCGPVMVPLLCQWS